MRSDVDAIMGNNHGLITRGQAIAAGLTPREIDRHVRDGAWVAVRRGVYVDATFHGSLTTLGDKQRLRDRAACSSITVPFVRSHTTSALEQEIAVLLPPSPMTHVTRPCVGTHNKNGIKHHLAPYPDDQVIEINGFKLLHPVRTAIDIAREYGHPYGVVAVDRVRWMGHPISEFEAVLEWMIHWPDRRNAVRAVARSDDGAESIGETLTRDLLEEMGYTDIETQFGLTDGRREAWADMRIGRHLFEFDGKLKFLREQQGGVALRPVEEVLWDEKVREDFLRGFHLGMSRLTWGDVWGGGREAAKRRLEREISATSSRWGTSIADLERYIIRRRRRAA